MPDQETLERRETTGVVEREPQRAAVTRDQLARIVEDARDAVIAKDLDGNVTFWNRGAERLYGYTAAEVVGQPIAVLTPPGKRDEVLELVRRTTLGEEIDRYETERLSKSGQRIAVSLTVTPVRDPSGAIVGAASFAHDITELKRAEQGLREAAHYARSLLEASLDPLVTINADGNITDANGAACQATGVPRDKLIGSNFASYFTAPELAERGYREVFATGSVKDFPLSIRHVSGEVTDVLYNAGVYRNEVGDIAGVFAAARDITARKRAEDELAKYRAGLERIIADRTAELAEANERLEETNKELEAFSYSVSHDLRTPLRAIDGFSRILLEDYADKLDAEGQRVLNVVRDSTFKMGRLIDDILAFSRAGRTEMRLEPVDMEALVRGLLADALAPALAGRVIAIDIGKLPPAEGDRAMLERVWTNLLDNAIKFTAPKPAARIEIAAIAGDGETVYHVNDNGVGFDMQYAGKLFGVFQRLHGGEIPGTGIGLAIVKRLISRHGGRVWAEGEPGNGASFYFTLPNKETDHAA